MTTIGLRTFIAVVVLVAGGALVTGAVIDDQLDVLDSIRKVVRGHRDIPSLPVESDVRLARTLQAITAQSPVPALDVTDRNGWRLATRAHVEDRIGALPQAQQSVDYRIIRETEQSGVRQLMIAFRTADGSELPAYLHLPAGTGAEAKLPGVLLVPGHTRDYQSGIEQLANDFDSYQHAAARQLAEQGFVTLTFELRGFGYLGKPLNSDHVLVAYNALLAGSSYKQIIMRDVAVAASLLRSLPRVDRDRVGIAGASLGAEIAVNYAALDTGIKSIVFHSYAKTGYSRPTAGSAENQPHYCHIFPLLDMEMKGEQWIWLLAPRPVLGMTRTWRASVDRDDIALFSQGWEDKSLFQYKLVEGGHEFFVEPTIRFFKQHL